MGVLNLWKILSSCCNHIDLNELRNKTLAVDLSIWICENSTQTKSFSQSNQKPYLRALFFRCKYLLELNCKLIFVREGDLIDLKQETMKKRNLARFHTDNFTQSQVSQSTKPLLKRSRYDLIANECCELLKYMGITVIRSPCGEAEKACAYLNRIGRCDGVITEDSDVFLYGARTVYKNFSLDNKSMCTIEEYRMDDIEIKLGYNRESLIALALLLGCDYDQKGIPGVGKEMACKFLHEMNEQNEKKTLDRLRSWSNDPCKQSQSGKYEEKIKKLVILNRSKFPNENIIKEFLEFSKMSEILLSEKKYLKIEWNRPSLKCIQLFNDIKQAWTYEYTAEKVIPLIILYEHSTDNNLSVKPLKISKKKRRAFIEYYEVVWAKMDHPEDKDLSELNQYVTFESISLFEKLYPKLVGDFNQEIDEKKNTRKNKKKKKQNNIEDVFDEQMGNSIMELYENCVNEPKTIKKLTNNFAKEKRNLDKNKINNKLKDLKENDDFDDDMDMSVMELYEVIEGKKLDENKTKKNDTKKIFKIIVLDTDSECEEKESRTQEDVEDIDLNQLLKSFNQISLESTQKKSAKVSRNTGQVKEKVIKIEFDKKIVDNQSDEDIIEIPFSQRMKNIYKNAHIFN